MSRGIFKVTPEFLAELLCLPDGSLLIPPGYDTDTFEFVVDHPDIKTGPAVNPTYSKDADGAVRFISWGQE